MTRTAELRIGVLAEDDTDCMTIAVLIRRILGERTGISKRRGGGCSQLLRKGRVWMAELAEDGCAALVFLHDLDRNPANHQLNDEVALRKTLEAIPWPAHVARHVCIPVEELEAWFFCDPDVLERVGRTQGRAAVSTAPHSIRRPKERLWHLSKSGHGKARYTTQLNPELARQLDLVRCAACCPAFRNLQAFLLDL